MGIPMLQTIRTAVSDARRYLITGIWSAQPKSLPRWKAAGVKAFKVLAVAVSEFFSDRCLLRASSLTFYTLMSIVPVFAVIFGIAKGFDLEKVLERELMAQMAGQEQALERILAFSRNMLANTKGGLIAGVGVLLMLWSAVKALGQIEAALNAMWDIRRQRSWGRRFSDYLALMLIGPVLVLASGSASVFIRTQFNAVAARFDILGAMAPLVFLALKLTPIIMVWALFTLIYMAMPNTRVRFSAAAAGAAVGAVLYQMVQWLYIDLQMGAAKQNAIYGSFAALPLFLAWIQLSWTLVLFGAEVCYAVEHAEDYCSPGGCPPLSASERRSVGLRVAHVLVMNFAGSGLPLTLKEIAGRLKLPGQLLKQPIADLVDAGILSQTRPRKSDQPAYQMAVDIHQLSVHRVSEALDSAGSAIEAIPLGSTGTPLIEECLDDMSRAAAASPANRLLKDIRP
jgi:membrane protein